MSRINIQKQIVTVVAKQFDINPNKINGDFNFQKDLDADSIDLIEMVMALENKFHAKIPDDEVQKLKTVNNVVNYIDKVSK